MTGTTATAALITPEDLDAMNDAKRAAADALDDARAELSDATREYAALFAAGIAAHLLATQNVDVRQALLIAARGAAGDVLRLTKETAK